MTRRGKRSRSARERRSRKRSMFDRKTGEVINIQERYVRFEVVPETLGFLSVDASQFGENAMMFLHRGEVLIDWRGEGTIQARPEVFDDESG